MLKSNKTKKGSKPPTSDPSSGGLLAFCADIHIGNHRHGAHDTKVGGVNSRCQIAIAAFKFALKVAKQRGAGMFVVGGDGLDQRRPEPPVIAAVDKALAAEAADIPVIWIPGNHEMMDARADTGNTALEPFYKHASVPREPEWFVLEAMGASVFCVPFDGRQTMTDYLRALLPVQKENEARKKILATHVGVFDDDSPPWLRGKDAIHKDMLFHAMEEGGFDAAFVGNFHENRQWVKDGRTVYQVGPLCPASFSDAGVFPKVGGLAIYDGEDVDLVEIPGPRFLKVAKGASLRAQVDKCAAGCTFFTRMEDAADVPDEPGEYVGVGGTVEVVEPPLPVDPAGLPSADSAEEAIDTFVSSMELPQGVAHADLLATTLDYWRRSAGEDNPDAP